MTVDAQQSFHVATGSPAALDPYGRMVVTDRGVRCVGARPTGEACNRLLALIVSRPWRIQCSRCKAINQAGISMGDGT